jgi:excisionase family DNA binding protein
MRRMTKMTAPAADEIFTLDEVSAFLKAGKRTVYRLAQNGEIPAFKLGGTWRFRRSELDRWIASEIAAKGNKNNPAR